MKLMILIALTLLCASAFGASKVAVVKLIRGEANVLTMGKTTPLKMDDWVENGAVVKTSDKSFVKLIFIDKSSMNVGPNSEMKIESFSGKDSGVIDLVKGKIRSQVTKDYLQINKDKSKLFIKTQNAVMGVRGTDFMISTNGKNTSTVLFEGEIVFNKLENRGERNSARLEEIVDRGVRMYPGEFSVMDANRPQPTVPSLLNIQQREKLEKNSEFDSSRTPSNETQETVSKSVIPTGLTGQQVSNNVEALKTEVAQVAPAAPATSTSPASADPEGYVKGDAVKPANGSFVHIDSGVIIPPGPDSVLDQNSNTFIPGQNSGSVGENGDFVPPPKFTINEQGEIRATVVTTEPAADGSKPAATPEKAPAPIPAQPPLVNNNPFVNPDVSRPDVFQPTGDRNPANQLPVGGVRNDIMTGATNNDILNMPGVRPPVGTVGGGISGVNDPTRGATSTQTDTTIIIKP